MKTHHDQLPSIPVEIWMTICWELDAKSLGCLLQVCHGFAQLGRDPYLWKQLCFHRGISSPCQPLGAPPDKAKEREEGPQEEEALWRKTFLTAAAGRHAKRTTSWIFLGHTACGKSTLLGQLLFVGGEANQWDGIPSRLAHLVDRTPVERKRGTTQARCLKLDTENRYYDLIDVPGKTCFIKNAHRAFCLADYGLLVVSSHLAEFEAGISRNGQTRLHVVLAWVHGIKQLVVAITKMEAARWNPNRYFDVKHEVLSVAKRVGYSASSLVFVPVSGWTGENVTRARLKLFDESVHRQNRQQGGEDERKAPPPPPSAPKMSAEEEVMDAQAVAPPWYSGPTLLGALHAMAEPTRQLFAPLRMCVFDWILSKAEDDRDGRRYTVLIGKVLQGCITRDTRVWLPLSGLVLFARRRALASSTKWDRKRKQPNRAIRLRRLFDHHDEEAAALERPLRVLSIERNGAPVARAIPGDIIGVRLNLCAPSSASSASSAPSPTQEEEKEPKEQKDEDKEDVVFLPIPPNKLHLKGLVLSDAEHHPLQPAYEVTVRLVSLPLASQAAIGHGSTFYCHSASTHCTIAEIERLLDKRTARVVNETPTHIPLGVVAVARCCFCSPPPFLSFSPLISNVCVCCVITIGWCLRGRCVWRR
ncbi:translation elongation factor EF-1 alpha [Balamuthia mandrillaris]